MTEKRRGCAVISVNGKIYVFGGNDTYNIHEYSEMFDPVMNEWNPIPNMKEAQWDCAACAIGDKTTRNWWSN